MAKWFELKCNIVSQKQLLPELPETLFFVTYSVGRKMQWISAFQQGLESKAYFSKAFKALCMRAYNLV